ncbi:type II toxin-antitoxin system VapC family toxin [Iningainema tapete]|uniref:Type II toxin-antitoxin system VapC family toxin n=1 Tax=Iningainema tapete BLCC-T55 TaxID=2748662 RepID=A0A8J6XIV1_9CYAN|nr:type II toxin-antitoxin system VapC family toxin [Iningainema tapete]MBD2771052.1 type II toxin-antitoxin system VapC family toxin [Iningainema tapete BLCC-T55]
MIFYYLDASAWVKRYYQELGTIWLQKLFAQNPNFACATLGFVEVVATLTRKQKAGQINSSQFQQKIQDLEVDWQNFTQVQLTAEVVDRSKLLAVSLALRGADAVHLGSAFLLQRRLSQGDQLILVTSDYELKVAARSSGLVVLDPQEEEAKSST